MFGDDNYSPSDKYNFPDNRLVLVTIANCPNCEQAKAELESAKVNIYREVDAIDMEAKYPGWLDKMGVLSAPTLLILDTKNWPKARYNGATEIIDYIREKVD